MKLHFLAPSICLALLLNLTACKKEPATQIEPAVVPVKPKEAATQIEQAFVATEGEVKTVANVASEALQKADYEAAVQSLELLKERGSLTVEQGIAVHNSMVSLEAKLIAAMEAGDPSARRAYEQLKRARRN
jgi:hypothetical protein